MRQRQSNYSHEVDHIVALKHGGQTQADDLAVACCRVTVRKAPISRPLTLSATLLCPCSTPAGTPGVSILSSRTPVLLVSPLLVGLPWCSSSSMLQLACCIVGR